MIVYGDWKVKNACIYEWTTGLEGGGSEGEDEEEVEEVEEEVEEEEY